MREKIGENYEKKLSVESLQEDISRSDDDRHDHCSLGGGIAG